MIKRLIFCTAFSIFAPSLCFAQSPDQIEVTQPAPTTPLLSELITFNESVAQAAKETTCEAVYTKLNQISSDLIERTAFVIANIHDYEVSKMDVLKVQSYADEAAKRAAQCSKILDIYKSVALKAQALKSKTL